MNILQEYALKKARIKDLEDELKQMEPEVRAAVLAEEGHKIKEKYGTFFVMERISYEYSELVEASEKLLKTRKEYEKKSGLAKRISKEELRFMPPRIGAPVEGYNWDKYDLKNQNEKAETS